MYCAKYFKMLVFLQVPHTGNPHTDFQYMAFDILQGWRPGFTACVIIPINNSDIWDDSPFAPAGANSITALYIT